MLLASLLLVLLLGSVASFTSGLSSLSLEESLEELLMELLVEELPEELLEDWLLNGTWRLVLLAWDRVRWFLRGGAGAQADLAECLLLLTLVNAASSLFERHRGRTAENGLVDLGWVFIWRGQWLGSWLSPKMVEAEGISLVGARRGWELGGDRKGSSSTIETGGVSSVVMIGLGGCSRSGRSGRSFGVGVKKYCECVKAGIDQGLAAGVWWLRWSGDGGRVAWCFDSYSIIDVTIGGNRVKEVGREAWEAFEHVVRDSRSHS